MRMLGRVALVIFGVLTSVLITEGLLRIIWHPVFLDKRFQRNDLEWMRQNVVLDRFGYRDRDFSLAKSKTTYRIYAVGDSYTYGWYISDPLKSYPKILENLLGEKFGGERFEVINASRPGFNPSQEIKRIREEGMKFSPDMVLMGINFFDFLPGNFIYTPKNSFPENLMIYQAVVGNYRRRQQGVKMERQVLSSYREDSPEMLKFMSEIEDMKKILKSGGQDFAIIVFPDLDPANPNSETRYPKYEEVLKKVSEKTNVKMIFLSKYFKDVEDKTNLVLNPTDPHPSIFADELTGEAIFKELNFGSQPPIPRVFPEKRSVKLTLGARLDAYESILSATPGTWVYFDYIYGDDVEQLFLPDLKDAKTTYLEDVLKTAKLGRHGAWVGAKIEYNIPIKSDNFSVPDKIYGFNIAGVSQITVFWNESGALHSRDLGLKDVDIVKEGEKINFRLKSEFARPINLVKVVFDVEASQFDIEGGVVVKIATTERFSGKRVNLSSNVLSVPKYVWCDKRLIEAKEASSGVNPMGILSIHKTRKRNARTKTAGTTKRFITHYTFASLICRRSLT